MRRADAMRKGPQARRLLLESLEDRRLLATELVSIVPPELGADTGNSTSSTPSICADGRFVAFESTASNLVVGDTNGLQDIFVRDTQAGITTRVSLDSDGNQANGESYAPTISADGRFVAFESSASNLVVADTNGAPDIFVRDTQTGTTRRVSLDSDGTQADNGSFFAAISGDGRYVTFQSDASNLVSGDTNGARDIFVKDLQTGVTTRVSTDSSGTQANDSSHSPAISGDGRYVAFQSSANNLASSTADRDLDPFDGDTLDAGWTFDTNGDFGPQYSLTTRPDWLRISVPAYHDIWYNNRDGAPLLYTDASDYPASFSLETLVDFGTGNLGAIPMWGNAGLLVRDTGNAAAYPFEMTFGLAKWSASENGVVWHVPGAELGRNSSLAGWASAYLRLDRDATLDSWTAYYKQNSSDAWITLGSVSDTRLPGGGISGTMQAGLFAKASQSTPAVADFGYFSSDGLAGRDTNGVTDVFVRDLVTGTTTRVSTNTNGAQADNSSSKPAISADGRYVAFGSEAGNLVAGDTNGRADIFVRDRQSGTTTRVSVNSNGEQANAYSETPSISADGRYVAFASSASNLALGDTNDVRDIFMRDMQMGSTVRVSLDSSGNQANQESYPSPAMSADGHFIAFTSVANNLNVADPTFDPDVYRVSVATSGTNEQPTAIELSSAAATENVPLDTLVGVFSTTDPDVDDTFTYVLTPGEGDADNASFVIPEGTNELRTAAMFDFEAKSSYSIRVRSTDAAGLTVEKQFTITVTDVQAQSPFQVQIDPHGYNGQYTLIGDGNDRVGPSAYELAKGTYFLALNGVGTLEFRVDDDGDVTSSSPAIVAGPDGALRFNTTTIHVDPDTFAGPYDVVSIGMPNQVEGTHDLAVVAGLTQSYTLRLGMGGSFQFTVDASGTVSTSSAAAQASGSTLTLNTRMIHVDPGAFGGSYDILWIGMPAPITGDGDLTVVAGLAQSYTLRVFNIGSFLFNVDASGTVSTSSGAAEASGSTLTLNTRTIHVDPGAYAGGYDILWIGMPAPVVGSGDVTVVAGLAENYTLRISNVGSFLFTVDAFGTVSTNSVAAQASGNTLTLNTRTIHVDPGAYAGGYDILWIGMPTWVTGSHDLAVVAGLTQSYTLRLAVGGSAAFTVDGDGIPAPSDITFTVNSNEVPFVLSATDADGIPVDIEDGAPNSGDGNGDGIPDSRQVNVVSFPNSVNGQYLTLVSPEGTSVFDVNTLGNPSTTDAPSLVAFPLGFLQFSVDRVAIAAATTTTICLPPYSRFNTYYKYGRTPDNVDPHWYEFLYDGITGAEILDDDVDGYTDQIILHFVDGQEGDDDLLANGIVSDPGAPALVHIQLPVAGTTPTLADGTLPAGTTSIQVHFSEQFLGGDNAANYQLQSLGPDDLLGTTDDIPVPLGVAFDGSTATLTFASLPESIYRLAIRDPMRDVNGDPIVGSTAALWSCDFVVAPALAHRVTSPSGFAWETEIGGWGAGQLVQGTANAFDGLNRLQVGGQDYAAMPSIKPFVESIEVTSSASVSLSGDWMDVPGLNAPLTVSTAAPVQLNAQLAITSLAHSDWTGQVRFVIDGVPQPIANWFGTPFEFLDSLTATTDESGSHSHAAASTTFYTGYPYHAHTVEADMGYSGIHSHTVNTATPAVRRHVCIDAEDWFMLEPGAHVVSVQVNGPVEVQLAGEHALDIVAFPPTAWLEPSVDYQELTSTTSASLAETWADVPDLNAILTLTTETPVRLSAQLNLSSASLLTWAGQVRFVVDGVAPPSPTSFNSPVEFVSSWDGLLEESNTHTHSVYGQTSYSGSPGHSHGFQLATEYDGAHVHDVSIDVPVTHRQLGMNAEEWMTLEPGAHTIAVQTRGPVDAHFWGEQYFQVAEFAPTSSSGVTVEYEEAISTTAATLSESWGAVPDLSTTLTLANDASVRLRSLLNISSTDAADWVGSMRFVVDGVPQTTANDFQPPLTIVGGWETTVSESGSHYHMLSTSTSYNVSHSHGAAKWSSSNGKHSHSLSLAIPSPTKSLHVNADEWMALGAGTHTISVEVLGPSHARFHGVQTLHAAGFLVQPQLTVEDYTQTLTTQRQTLAGLQVHREITVPQATAQDFSRTVDVFENTTDAPVRTTVRIAGNLGSDTATRVFMTSDGDTNVEPADQWIGTDDSDGVDTPAIIHYIHGPAGLQPTSVAVIGDNVEWSYEITVPAHSSLRLAHFTILATTRVEATTAAASLVAPDSFGSEATAYLALKEQFSLANFDYNLAPLAHAGGPYTMSEGSTIQLDATATTDANLPEDVLTYAWDLDRDGEFDDAFGITPHFSEGELDGPQTMTIGLRVIDLGGEVGEDTATVVIDNAPPQLVALQDSGPAAPGASVRVTVVATDVTGDPLWYEYDFDNDGAYECGNDTGIVEHTYWVTGTYPVGIRVTDGDGGVLRRSTTIRVLPVLTFTSSNQYTHEGDDPTEGLKIDAQLTEALAIDLVAPITVSGTADYLADYSLSSTVMFIPAGAIIGSVYFHPSNDLLDELDETLTIALVSPVDVVVGEFGTHTVTILDDDAPSAVLFEVVSQDVAEGAGSAVVTACLSTPSGLDVTVPLAISGTAVSPADYTVPGLSIVIPAGETAAALVLNIVDDNAVEPGETIVVAMLTPDNAVLSTEPGTTTKQTITIGASDPPSVWFTWTSKNVSESDGSVLVGAQLSTPFYEVVEVPITVGGTAGPSDYSLSADKLVFSANSRTASLIVYINDDVAEARVTESITLTMGDPTGGIQTQAGKSMVQLAVTDDDVPILTFTQPSQTVWEDDGAVYVTAELSKPAEYSIGVLITVSDGTAKLASDDYTKATNPVLTIPANSREASIKVVDITHDTTNEPKYESINVGIEKAWGGSVAIGDSTKTTHVIAVRDDDPKVSFAASQSVVEGNTTVKVRASLLDANNTAAASNKEIKVAYALSGTAVRNADYTISPAPGSTGIAYLIIPVNAATGETATYGEASVTVKQDTLDEANETITLAMNSAKSSNVLVGASTSHTVTITDDDGAPQVFFDEDAHSVPDESVVIEEEHTYTVGVKLSAASGQKVTVPIELSGAAAEGWHYTISSKCLTINAGQTTATTQITVKDDSFAETSLLPRDIILTIGKKSTTATRTSPFTYRLLIADDDSFLGSPLVIYGKFVVVGGLIAGATAFFDANKNGVLDFLDLNGDADRDAGEPDEVWTTTSPTGLFGLTVPEVFDVDSSGVIEPQEGQMMVVGGTDVTTGLPLGFPLIAPPGWSVISSLTTLMAALVNEHSFSAGDAEQRVREVFELPDVDLTHFNVIAATAAGDPYAPAVMAAIVKLENTIVQTAKLLSSVPAAPPLALAAEWVVADIAAKIVEPQSAFDLSDPLLLETVIVGVADRGGVEFDSTISSGAATVIAAGSEHIDSISLSADVSFLTDIAQTQVVAQGEVAAQLADVATGLAAIDDVVAANTGAALQSQIAAATIGDVIVPELTVSDARIVENDSGAALQEFTVTLSSSPASPVSVGFTTWDGSAIAGQDYEATAGILTWGTGDNTPRTVQVPISGDTLFEADEAFLLILTNPVGAAVARSRADGTIANDDPLLYVAPSEEGLPNELEVLVEERYLALYRNGELVLDGQFSAPFPISIAGASNVENSLRVDLAGPSAMLNSGLAFQGGSLADSLIVIDNGATSVVRYPAEPDAGVWMIDGATISYTGVEWATDYWAPFFVGLPATCPEGTELSLYGWVADPTFAEIATYQWKVTRNGVPFMGGSGAEFLFVPSDDGEYVVSLTTTVADSGAGTTTRTVTVNNVAPTLSLTGVSAADEGATYTLHLAATDPGADTITSWIDWGDGTTIEEVSGNPEFVTHVYLDGPAVYSISATVTDQDGSSNAANTVSVAVQNVTPSVELSGHESAYRGSVYRLTIGIVSDPGVDTVTAYRVHWGDGQTEDTETGGELTHVYLDCVGPVTITIDLLDEDDDDVVMPDVQWHTEVVRKTIVVYDVSSTLQNVVVTPGISENGVILLRGDLVDSQSLDGVELEVNWGDGTVESFSYSAGTTGFAETHSYMTGGFYAIDIALKYQGIGLATANAVAAVTGVVLRDGQLQVVGTARRDNVLVGRLCNQLFVISDLIPHGFHTLWFNYSDVTDIEMTLGAGADDAVVAWNIYLNTLIRGGAGADRLKGGGGNDIVLGDAGNDLLVGGMGRDLLIGGVGSDCIYGDWHDDILIAGQTYWDANDIALLAIIDEWSRTDLDYAARVDNLRGIDNSHFASRRNGDYFLSADGEGAAAYATVFNDNARDTLTGGCGQDWFLANLYNEGDQREKKDKITDLTDEEYAEDLEFILEVGEEE